MNHAFKFLNFVRKLGHTIGFLESGQKRDNITRLFQIRIVLCSDIRYWMGSKRSVNSLQTLCFILLLLKKKMDLLNPALETFSSQIAAGKIALNVDIFETNLINLVILDGGLFYLISGALSESLLARQQKIKTSIDDSKDALEKAKVTLEKSIAKLTTAESEVELIQKSTKETVMRLKNEIRDEGKAESLRLSTAVQSKMETASRLARIELTTYISELMLKRVANEIKIDKTPNLNDHIMTLKFNQLYLTMGPKVQAG